jgi:GMP synthase (glutamine-hydrolysing)
MANAKKSKPRTALIIQNNKLAPLGLLETHFLKHNFKITIVLADTPELYNINAQIFDLVVILGGHIGANDEKLHPFLEEEFKIVRDRASNSQSILGICLGAQIIAKALGGTVEKAPKPEVGWISIHSMFTSEPIYTPIKYLIDNQVKVFSWHYDEFLLPKQAVLLANSEQYHQAFMIGDNIFGLQFHAEASLEIVRDWYSYGFPDYIDKDEFDKKNQELFKKYASHTGTFWDIYLENLSRT